MSLTMNTINELTDEEFVPFLKNLGVESYSKSFEWMLADSDFSGILRWLYDNIDNRNSLSAREDYRYIEIEKKGLLLTPEQLETSKLTLFREYEGLTLPNDVDALTDVKQQINFEKEKIKLLEEQEEIVENLLKHNELTKAELNRELNQLNASQKQCLEDIQNTSEECLSLSKQVEEMTENIVDVVADTIAIYNNAHLDKETSKKFYMYGPFEAYTQSQGLFKSHFDLYTCRKFDKKQCDASLDIDDKYQLKEARTIERRLHKAIHSYIESNAEMNGDQATISFLVNYDEVHPSQIPVKLMEAMSAVELLSQEEAIVKRQLEHAVNKFADTRTDSAAGTVARAALAHREEVYKDLCCLHDATRTAVSLDGALYYAIRRELRNLADLLNFASLLKQHVLEEQSAIETRMELMSDIIVQQKTAQHNLEDNDKITQSLINIMDVKSTEFPAVIQKYDEILYGIMELRESINQEFVTKENSLTSLISSTQPLRQFMNDGCTKLPNCWDRTVATLIHSLRDEMAKLDKRVVDVSGLYASVKNGDKYNTRKLWQWFLTDKTRFLAKIKEIQSISRL